MKLTKPRYQLIHLGDRDWQFEESLEMDQPTARFHEIMEAPGGAKSRATSLRAFLKHCPFHIDALHHYAVGRFYDGKFLDAYAFSHTAVAIGRQAFPPEFKRGRDFLRGGFFENRPFLRAIHGLSLAQAALGDYPSAIETTRELLDYDPEDRMGGRLQLPLYLLQEGLADEALQVFATPGWEATFYTAEFLRVLALFRLDRLKEAKAALSPYLRDFPQVVRFLVDPTAPPPANDSPFGIISGSEYEGWTTAAQYAPLLRQTKGLPQWLTQESRKAAAQGWARPR